MFFGKKSEWRFKLMERLKLILMSSKEKRYFLWRKAAIKAKEDGLTTVCAICEEPIFPDEFVATGTVAGKKIIVHAGLHYTLEKSDLIICETGGVGIGYWNGKGINGIGESPSAKAARTGKPVVFNY